MWRSYFTENKWLLWSWGGFAFIILSLLAQTGSKKIWNIDGS